MEEDYTTNVFGGIDGANNPSDTYTRGILQLGARYSSRRAQLVADYSFWGDYYNKYHSLNEYVNYLNLGARAELIPDHFSVNLSGFASPIVTNRAGVISAGGELLSSTNISNTYGYLIQPEYRFRLSDFATSVTDIGQSGVYFSFPSTSNATFPVASNISNASVYTASQRFISGEYFGRLQWDVGGDLTKLKQQNLTEIQRNGTLDLAYALDRSFQVLATGGYNDFEVNVPLQRPLSGPEYLGGFRYTPSPSLRLMAEAGIRNRTSTYLGSLQWKLTERTSLEGVLTDGISTPQGALLSGLSGFGASLLDPSLAGSPLSSVGTVPFSTNPTLGTVSPLASQGLAIDNLLYHDRRATLTLTHELERSTFSLSYYQDRRTQVEKTIGVDNSGSIYGVTASVSHRVRSSVSGYAALSYSHGDEFAGHDDIYQAYGGLDWSISDKLTLYAQNRFIVRQSSYASALPSGHTSIEEVALGIRRSF